MDKFPIEKLKTLVQKVIPIVYDDNLSIYEVMGKVVDKVNEVIDGVNAYFDEDIDTVVGNILLDWYDSGKLGTIINDTLFTSKADKTYVDSSITTLRETIDTEIATMRTDISGLTADFQQFARNVKDFGVVGDGITDDTIKLQTAFNSLQEGDVLYFAPGTYLVSKNSALTDFPNNDQPCLLLRDKKNIRLIGNHAILQVKTHAQGILELQRCENIKIDGLTYEGLGIFPAIDPVSGYGEKGTDTGGYATAGFWSYYKNNSYDTSARLKADGTPWGTFHGGFIGNVSYGLFIHRGCKKIDITGCEAYGFNYGGFGVGGNVNNVPILLGYEDSEDILFYRCYGHDNYSQNFETCKSNRVTFDKCISERSGHPDASINHTYVDPGYGYQLKGSIYGLAKNTFILNSISLNDKRKGVDGHAGRGLTVKGNIIDGAWINGINYKSTDPQQLSTEYNISDNKIYNVGAGKNPGAPISVGGLDRENYTKANALALGMIKNNLIQNCFSVYGLIHVDTFDTVHISGNQIRGLMAAENRASSFTPYGIYFGYSIPEDLNYMGICCDNIIDSEGAAGLVGGIIARNMDAGHVSGNVIKLQNDAAVFGVRLWACDRVNVTNNSVILANIGLPYDLTTNGAILGNQAKGGNSQSTPLIGQTIALRLSYVDGVETRNWFSGEQFVSSIVDDTNGVRFNLQNVPMGVKPSARISLAADNGLSSVSAWADYIYTRSVSSDNVVFGTRTARNGSRITYANYYNGGIDIEITI